MTTTERAEKISEEIVGIVWTTESVERIKTLITSQLDEAVNDCLNESIKINLKTAEDCYHEGYAAAREQAIKIADRFNDDCDGRLIAERIRTMTPGGK